LLLAGCVAACCAGLAQEQQCACCWVGWRAPDVPRGCQCAERSTATSRRAQAACAAHAAPVFHGRVPRHWGALGAESQALLDAIWAARAGMHDGAPPSGVGCIAHAGEPGTHAAGVAAAPRTGHQPPRPNARDDACMSVAEVMVAASRVLGCQHGSNAPHAAQMCCPQPDYHPGVAPHTPAAGVLGLQWTCLWPHAATAAWHGLQRPGGPKLLWRCLLRRLAAPVTVGLWCLAAWGYTVGGLWCLGRPRRTHAVSHSLLTQNLPV
jgi:hypothetical protein